MTWTTTTTGPGEEDGGREGANVNSMNFFLPYGMSASVGACQVHTTRREEQFRDISRAKRALNGPRLSELESQGQTPRPAKIEAGEGHS